MSVGRRTYLRPLDLSRQQRGRSPRNVSDLARQRRKSTCSDGRSTRQDCCRHGGDLRAAVTRADFGGERRSAPTGVETEILMAWRDGVSVASIRGGPRRTKLVTREGRSTLQATRSTTRQCDAVCDLRCTGNDLMLKRCVYQETQYQWRWTVQVSDAQGLLGCMRAAPKRAAAETLRGLQAVIASILPSLQ